MSKTTPGPGQCKRYGCENEAMSYSQYEDCCSLYCRDVHYLDTEIKHLEKENQRLREALLVVRNKKNLIEFHLEIQANPMPILEAFDAYFCEVKQALEDE